MLAFEIGKGWSRCCFYRLSGINDPGIFTTVRDELFEERFGLEIVDWFFQRIQF